MTRGVGLEVEAGGLWGSVDSSCPRDAETWELNRGVERGDPGRARHRRRDRQVISCLPFFRRLVLSGEYRACVDGRWGFAKS